MATGDYTDTAAVLAALAQTSDTAIIDVAVTAASRVIDGFCNVREGYFIADTEASTKEFAGSGTAIQWIPPNIEVTLVESKDSPGGTYSSWVSADWIAATGDPAEPDFNTLPTRFLIVASGSTQGVFTLGKYSGGSTSSLRGFSPLAGGIRRRKLVRRSYPTIRVTAKWGFSETVPGAISRAALIHAARLYKRGQAGYSDTLASSDFGQLFFTKELDPDVKAILESGRWVSPATGRALR
jgi:hypothetical protein